MNGRVVVAAYAIICFLVGLASLKMSISGGIPMPPETHGDAMYIIPGELWSVVSMAQGLLMLWAISFSRWGVLAFACVIGAAIDTAIAVMAETASFGFLTSLIAGGAGLLHAVIAILAVQEAIGHKIKLAMDRIEAIIERVAE